MADVYVDQADVQSLATGVGALTLAQAAKLEKDTYKQGIMELFVAENEVAKRLPFQEIEGNSYIYDYEKTLPAVGFRAVNEGYEKSHGTTDQRSVGLAICGGDLDVDKFLVKTRSGRYDQRTTQEKMQIKALSFAFLTNFFTGDRSTSGNKAFDGINILLADTYYNAKGVNWEPATAGFYAWDATTGRSPLKDNIDLAINKMIGKPDVIYLHKDLKLWLSWAAEKNNQISIGTDQWGYQVDTYRGIPLCEIEQDAAGTDVIGFTETTSGNTTNTASIYLVKFGEDEYVSGLQNGGMDITDLGEIDEAPVLRTRVEWYAALANFHPKGCVRVKGARNAFSA